MNALGANQHSIACMSTRRLDPGSEPLTFQLVEDPPYLLSPSHPEELTAQISSKIHINFLFLLTYNTRNKGLCG